MVTTMKEAVKEIFETFLHFIPYIFALICFTLSLVTVIKREPRSERYKFIVKLWNIYAVFECVLSLLHRHEASNAGELLILSCALFEITQQVFDTERDNRIITLNTIVCVCCTASLTLAIIELVSR